MRERRRGRRPLALIAPSDTLAIRERENSAGNEDDEDDVDSDRPGSAKGKGKGKGRVKATSAAPPPLPPFISAISTSSQRTSETSTVSLSTSEPSVASASTFIPPVPVLVDTTRPYSNISIPIFNLSNYLLERSGLRHDNPYLLCIDIYHTSNCYHHFDSINKIHRRLMLEHDRACSSGPGW
ncbi:hypothetical protein VTK56DRAFT_6047 [Thermocarpiscus australiensis]